jgi:hypothetical protein
MNRSRAIDALIEKGLFALFELLTANATDEIIERQDKAVMTARQHTIT